MNKETMVHQLLAIRSSVDAILSSLGGQMQEEAGCQHKRKENLTVMGGEEEYRCLDCGLEWTGEDFITNKLNGSEK